MLSGAVQAVQIRPSPTPPGSAAFLLGPAFDVLMLAAFRHELHLTGDPELMTALLVYCFGMIILVTIWCRRVPNRTSEKLDSNELRPTTEWGPFIWGSLFLFASYFALLLMVADFQAGERSKPSQQVRDC